MRTSSRYLHLFLTAISCLILAAGCSHRSSNAKPAYGFADSIAIDSTTLWRPEGAPDYRATAYIMDSMTPVYMIRGNYLLIDTVLRLADTVNARLFSFMQYFDSRFYSVEYHGRQGYIRGTSLGRGVINDFDNDGKKDLILYGYSKYVIDTTQENSFNPFRVKFISATGAVSEVSDTAYSDMTMNEVSGVRLSDRVHCYELSAGYPACSYPQYHYIIAYGRGRPEIIHRTINSMDGAYGDYCEFYYPSDTARHTDTIYISHRLSMPLSDESDSVVQALSDSTILYLHDGRWAHQTYLIDTTRD